MKLNFRSTGLRASSLIVGLMALLLLAGCGGESKDDPKPGTGAPKLSGTVDLVAEKDGFSKKEATVEAGTIKITVSNPQDSGGKHGVGIDGGQFKNVKGAPVEPGRSTSLTVAVEEGTYTIFDSYRKNRDKGFETKLTVKKK